MEGPTFESEGPSGPAPEAPRAGGTATQPETGLSDQWPSYDPAVAEMMLSQSGGDGLTEYLGLQLVEVGPGTATAEVVVRPEMLQAFGAVHGGVVATLIDHVLGAAVFPSVPVGTWPATLEFKLNYLAAVRDGVIRATGQMLVLRRRTAVVQVDVTNDGRPVATALGTISLNPPKPG